MKPLDAKTTLPLTGGPSFSLANRVERLVWRIVWFLLASWTPGKLNPWRVLLLKLFGAQLASGAAVVGSATVWLPRNLSMGRNSTIGPSVDCYNMAPIRIGSYTVVSQRAVLCCGTHDVSDENFQLVTRPIEIGSNVWIAAEAFIGPGVRIGDGVVVGARGCTFSDLEPWNIYIGNPARKLRERRHRAE